MEDDQLTQAMKELGLTTNEARAYITLLRQHPATGYELAASSGVPRSAIYSVLKNLEHQGLVNAIRAKPVRYVPLPPERLYSLLGARHAQRLKEAKRLLDGLTQQEAQVPTWTIRGYAEMIGEAKRLISESQQSVFSSLWRREADGLAVTLADAVSRDVDVVLFSFNPLPRNLGQQMSYGIPEADLEEYWTHRIILIVDNEQVLLGAADKGEENRVVVSQEEALISVARSNLVLDITLYGERTKTDTSKIVETLTAPLAPVEKLVSGSLRDGHHNGDLTAVN